LLAFFIINLATAVGILVVQFYICRIRPVRMKLRWILTVLSLLSIAFLSETALIALSYLVDDKSDISMFMYALDGFLGVVGGFCYSAAFAIFALEYYQASSLV